MNSEDPTKIDNSIITTYNYTNNSIYLNQIIHTLNTDGYVEIPFLSNGPPNVIINRNQYNSNTLYITGSNKLIDGITYDGELVIEHSPITNDSSKKLFTVFLLKSDKNNSLTAIDSLILNNNVSNIGINTKPSEIGNSLNTDSKQIYYIDKNGNEVIIFTRPILINSNINTLNTQEKIFTTNTTNNYVIMFTKYTDSMTEPFSLKEGLTNTAYCQPIELIDSSGAEDANLVIPLTGIYTPNDATNNIIRTAINFMAFVLVLGLTYVLTPMIYNDYIIALIQSKGQSKMNRIRSIDTYITVLFISATLSFISQGVANNNPNSTIIGFFIGLFFILSFVIVQSKKLEPSWRTMQFSTGSGQITADYNHVTITSDFLKFIFDNFSFFMANIFLGGFILAIVFLFAYLGNAFSGGGILSSAFGIVCVVLVCVYLTIAIKSFTKDDD
jgi:hypothetical protein